MKLILSYHVDSTKITLKKVKACMSQGTFTIMICSHQTFKKHLKQLQNSENKYQGDLSIKLS